jgi:hypothetical protein
MPINPARPSAKVLVGGSLTGHFLIVTATLNFVLSCIGMPDKKLELVHGIRRLCASR